MWTDLSDPAIIKQLGDRIKELRIRRGMRQEDLADKSGISLSTITKIEKGLPVSILLFISVLRTLGLLENLDLLIPEIGISPIQMRKLKGKEKIRVRLKICKQ